jgi:serine/threonine protein kinase
MQTESNEAVMCTLHASIFKSIKEIYWTFTRAQDPFLAKRSPACRYEVLKASGKGVFSSVVSAYDKLRQNTDGSNPIVAIKMIRANETMFKAAKQELDILSKLADNDPDNRKHIIRLLRSFEYRNHLCMVRVMRCVRLSDGMWP